MPRREADLSAVRGTDNQHFPVCSTQFHKRFPSTLLGARPRPPLKACSQSPLPTHPAPGPCRDGLSQWAADFRGVSAPISLLRPCPFSQTGAWLSWVLGCQGPHDRKHGDSSGLSFLTVGLCPSHSAPPSPKPPLPRRFLWTDPPCEYLPHRRPWAGPLRCEEETDKSPLSCCSYH